MRESSFVCCCLHMSTFWVNYSVSVTVSLLTFIAPIQLCCESVVGHHMHVCSLYFLDVFRDDYAFIQQYYIYPSSYQKTFHSIYFHTALLHMGCEKITTQHMLHHLHSTPPPPLHGASSQGSAWSNASLLRTSWNCATFICYDWQTNKGNISVTPKWLQRETKQLSVKTLF